ncbi:hypothetical protein MPH_10273 [Macrophomina phaseolina MS6]|uniref:Uncharacterized protein n=1 Tax=Macrophomina phaseolina (strain MS6) TaxID=1126212 RepID=K2RIE4_MACPH|nr:hypothetical protein MPH_10273 [Macrophomina phaseolina MS6]
MNNTNNNMDSYTTTAANTTTMPKRKATTADAEVPEQKHQRTTPAADPNIASTLTSTSATTTPARSSSMFAPLQPDNASVSASLPTHPNAATTNSAVTSSNATNPAAAMARAGATDLSEPLRVRREFQNYQGEMRLCERCGYWSPTTHFFNVKSGKPTISCLHCRSLRSRHRGKRRDKQQQQVKDSARAAEDAASPSAASPAPVGQTADVEARAPRKGGRSKSLAKGPPPAPEKPSSPVVRASSKDSFVVALPDEAGATSSVAPSVPGTVTEDDDAETAGTLETGTARPVRGSWGDKNVTLLIKLEKHREDERSDDDASRVGSGYAANTVEIGNDGDAFNIASANDGDEGVDIVNSTRVKSSSEIYCRGLDTMRSSHATKRTSDSIANLGLEGDPLRTASARC